MGGGALMTPLLVLLFKVQPLAAVSSDLVASPRNNRVGRRAGGLHVLGRLRLPDNRDAAAALPDAALLGASRHRPGPGDPPGRLGGRRPPAVRRLPAWPDGVTAGRQHPR